ncbi:uncharacterized protein FOMMEDRAFT_162876 [Fomitiporia mediterranea MF3/22]|uniref:Uncharacterized protein n=1 Tax=Fomitiporia mediterranea (strain MF3/22) TaxID=694068 RepID=R7SFQ4_FOMME|nr:uncharacterized protein FOMMEDRAFT_160552 [Fomitiporia mediterranea MF3/22]XP_007272178.1 uncharacterized protein FOMMEDRAFT_162876 [Fomitiporia mediterranea MF3/22]EJC97561.1 hypothetical protein FOMMEDRAFT_162876 [Fomitiporia mediterranea MF3/22]EJC99494.1 hypothetical protein FOMMEDRAFT_160552 [Fomitiporia mediterranea MF3/22]
MAQDKGVVAYDAYIAQPTFEFDRFRLHPPQEPRNFRGSISLPVCYKTDWWACDVSRRRPSAMFRFFLLTVLAFVGL